MGARSEADASTGGVVDEPAADINLDVTALLTDVLDFVDLDSSSDSVVKSLFRSMIENLALVDAGADGVVTV